MVTEVYLDQAISEIFSKTAMLAGNEPVEYLCTVAAHGLVHWQLNLLLDEVTVNMHSKLSGQPRRVINHVSCLVTAPCSRYTSNPTYLQLIQLCGIVTSLVLTTSNTRGPVAPW